MTDPGGTPLSGVRTLAATSTDAHSGGVAQVSFQYARTGTNTWTTVCALTESPLRLPLRYHYRGRRRLLLQGHQCGCLGKQCYLRGLSRTVDNTVASVSLEDPGAYLTGAVPLTAAANSTAGVASIRIQVAPAGTTSWSTLCTIAAAPLRLQLEHRRLHRRNLRPPGGTHRPQREGSHLRNGGGKEGGQQPAPCCDIRTTNGGAIPGRLEPGDSMSFVYSQQVNLATVSPGWAGGRPFL